MRKLKIPYSFLRAPFFENGENTVDYCAEQPFLETMKRHYFVYDIAVIELEEAYKPWEKLEETIPVVCNLWKEQKQELSLLFRQRKRQEAKGPMICFTAHLLSMLYWMNGTGVVSLQSLQLERLRLKPVNASERIGFILEAPNHYHAFIQLCELYEEIEKQFFKQMAIKKTSPL